MLCRRIRPDPTTASPNVVGSGVCSFWAIRADRRTGVPQKLPENELPVGLTSKLGGAANSSSPTIEDLEDVRFRPVRNGVRGGVCGTGGWSLRAATAGGTLSLESTADVVFKRLDLLVGRGADVA